MRSYKKIAEMRYKKERRFRKVCADELELREWNKFKISRSKLKNESSKSKTRESKKELNEIISKIYDQEGYVPLPYKMDDTRYSDLKIAEALYLSGGFITDAAKRLQIAPTTISKRLKKSEFLRKVMEVIEDERLDTTEKSLFKLIEQLHYPAVSFYLTQKGARRGYYDRKIIDQNINVSGQVKIDLSDVPKDVLVELAGWKDDIIDIEGEEVYEKDRNITKITSERKD